MRCRACNDPLTDIEAVRKWPNTEDYTELCTRCLVQSDDWLYLPSPPQGTPDE